MTWGLVRRIFLDATNVRVEHWRTGDPVVRGADEFELPDHYAQGLRYYAQAKCLAKPGPGQDLKLSAWYESRWQRILARIRGRIDAQANNMTRQMGGSTRGMMAPPSPSLPWQYGSRTR